MTSTHEYQVAFFSVGAVTAFLMECIWSIGRWVGRVGLVVQPNSSPLLLSNHVDLPRLEGVL